MNNLKMDDKSHKTLLDIITHRIHGTGIFSC